MDITGKIIQIDATQQISDRFRKRTVAIEYATNPQYPETPQLEFVQDRCDLLDGFQVGQEVTIHFDVKGRKWTDRDGKVRFFTTLQAWRIQSNEQSNTMPTGYQPQAGVPEIPPPPEFNQGAQVDEVPF